MLQLLQAIDLALGVAMAVLLGRSTAAEIRKLWKNWTSRGFRTINLRLNASAA